MMNKFQKAYAMAKANHEVAVEKYNQAFRDQEEYFTLTQEQEPLLESEEGTVEYERALEIEGRLRNIENAIDIQTSYKATREALRVAEEDMVKWSFEVLKKRPAVFAKMGVRYSDIEVLLPHMNNVYSRTRKELVNLAFHFAG